MSAALLSEGRGDSPGVYHRPKGVPSSICRSYTDMWGAPVSRALVE